MDNDVSDSLPALEEEEKVTSVYPLSFCCGHKAAPCDV